MYVDKEYANEIKQKLDKLLLREDGRVHLLHSDFYKQFRRQDLLIWCHLNAIYTIPTIELIDWLRNQICDKYALEVGAGNSCIGYYLNIHSTDSYCQHSPLIQLIYQSGNVTTTNPGSEVEKIDAESAVKRYKPDVTIASWLTQKWYSDLDTQASIMGADESIILANTDKYIHIGNCDSHGLKRILELNHEVYQPEWLITRAIDPSKNVIYIWKK